MSARGTEQGVIGVWRRDTPMEEHALVIGVALFTVVVLHSWRRPDTLELEDDAVYHNIPVARFTCQTIACVCPVIVPSASHGRESSEPSAGYRHLASTVDFGIQVPGDDNCHQPQRCHKNPGVFSELYARQIGPKTRRICLYPKIRH